MPRWMCITPFVKQTIVSSGAMLNLAGAALMLAYPSGLLMQLRSEDSDIPLEKSMESWIASMPSFSSLLGILLTVVTMSRYGRRMIQIASIIILILGWLAIHFANTVSIILLGRFCHGLAMGCSTILSPILVAEYSSPRYRGGFIMFGGVISSLTILYAQVTALYIHWRTNAIICTAITIVNLPIAIYSPESPSWLAANQRYDECRRAFRWLRGDCEEEELAKMIKASEISQKSIIEQKSEQELSIRKKMVGLKKEIMKKEFYKPLIVMIHVYTISQCSGSNLMSIYVFDLLENIVGKGYNEHVLSLNIIRVFESALAIYMISKAKRRTMFLVLSGSNAILMLITASFTYARYIGILTFDFLVLGMILIHLQLFLVITCTVPMPYAIAGEIIPLKYKSVVGGFSIIVFLLNQGIYVKSFPYLVSTVGIYGAYVLYAVISTYCLAIVYWYLPETKDRTLLEIEEEITGKSLGTKEQKAVEPLII